LLSNQVSIHDKYMARGNILVKHSAQNQLSAFSFGFIQRSP